MGLFDKLKGVKEPEEGTPALPRTQLEDRLLAVNEERVPFTVTRGEGGEDGDLVAEWKIVDASWYEIFAKAGIEKSHRLLLVLDENDHEVRVLEQSWEVEWRAGVPSLSLSAEKFQGRTFGSKSFGTAYAFKGVNPLDFGEVYNYRFDVSEMKEPVTDVITGAGWRFVPVVSKGKLTG
ncbi:MAG: hypothetical protein ACRDLB_07360 [Actinomycetota bacterium]